MEHDLDHDFEALRGDVARGSLRAEGSASSALDAALRLATEVKSRRDAELARLAGSAEDRRARDSEQIVRKIVAEYRREDVRPLEDGDIRRARAVFRGDYTG
ncbi:MAG: hypothetical protein AAFR16_03940 [Pseudomonadota bacterium]